MKLLKSITNIKNTVVEIYKRPRYILLNIVSIIVYYYIFTILISYQNYGILLIELPILLLYAMILLSSILFTISIYAIKNTIRNQAKITGSATSIITILFGGVIGGCGCAAPIIYGLTAIGISLSTTSYVAYVINNYVTQIFLMVLFIDAILILYYLNKLSYASCRVKSKKDKKIKKRKIIKLQ